MAGELIPPSLLNWITTPSQMSPRLYQAPPPPATNVSEMNKLSPGGLIDDLRYKRIIILKPAPFISYYEFFMICLMLLKLLNVELARRRKLTLIWDRSRY